MNTFQFSKYQWGGGFQISMGGVWTKRTFSLNNISEIFRSVKSQTM